MQMYENTFVKVKAIAIFIIGLVVFASRRNE